MNVVLKELRSDVEVMKKKAAVSPEMPGNIVCEVFRGLQESFIVGEDPLDQSHAIRDTPALCAGQVTDDNTRRMRFSCWITKATDARS